jgi:S1-C subfamily serine protease
MPSGWYYQSKGRAVGPVSLPELRALVQLGKVSHDTLVSSASHGPWGPAGAAVTGLFEGKEAQATATVDRKPQPSIVALESGRMPTLRPPLRPLSVDRANPQLEPVPAGRGDAIHPVAWIAVGGGLAAAIITFAALILVRVGGERPREEVAAESASKAQIKDTDATPLERRVPSVEVTAEVTEAAAVSVAEETPSEEPLPGKPTSSSASVVVKPADSPVQTSATDPIMPPASAAPPIASNTPLAPDALFAKASPAVVVIEFLDRRQTNAGAGSGFFISTDGLVVTNHHVLEEGRYFDVKTPDGRTIRAQGVVARDAGADLAILRVGGSRFPSLRLASDPLPAVGKKVYAIGTPLGVFSNTLSDGLVSAHRKMGANNLLGYDSNLRLIQHTAAISHGSSGGPLLIDDGSVVGVNTLVFTEIGANSVYMSVPVERLRRLLKSIPGGSASP